MIVFKIKHVIIKIKHSYVYKFINFYVKLKMSDICCSNIYKNFDRPYFDFMLYCNIIS